MTVVENCEAGRNVGIEWRDDATAYLFSKNLATTLGVIDCLLAKPVEGDKLNPSDHLRVVTIMGVNGVPIGSVFCDAKCQNIKSYTPQPFTLGRLGVTEPLG